MEIKETENFVQICTDNGSKNLKDFMIECIKDIGGTYHLVEYSNIDGDLRTNYYKNHFQTIDFLQKAVYLNIKITIFKWK